MASATGCRCIQLQSLENPYCSCKLTRYRRLQWAQEPPHGAAVWLHCKTGKGGGILPSSMQHVFLPSVEVHNPQIFLQYTAPHRQTHTHTATTHTHNIF